MKSQAKFRNEAQMTTRKKRCKNADLIINMIQTGGSVGGLLLLGNLVSLRSTFYFSKNAISMNGITDTTIQWLADKLRHLLLKKKIFA